MAIQAAVATEVLSAAGGQGVAGMLNAIITAIEGSGGGHTHLLAVGATDVTATAAEVNIMDGVTSTAAELNILDGVTADKDELNLMDGCTATTAELNYVDGVTSAIQTQIDTKAPTASPSFTGDVGLATNTNIQVNSTDPYRTINIMPGFLKPTTTSGCATVATVEAGTNDIDYDVLDFDTTTAEKAFANFHMPDSWDAGTIQFRYVWTNASGLTTETVEFELSGRSFADNDAIDQANGTAVGVADTWIAQGDIHISSWSGNVTLAGTAAAGELVHIEVKRDVANDNMTGDARLIALQIRYKIAKYSD